MYAERSRVAWRPCEWLLAEEPATELGSRFRYRGNGIGGRRDVRRPGFQQLTRYQPWFDNARRLKDLVAKLEIASVHAVEQAEKTHKRRNTAGSTPTGEHQA